VSRNARCWRSGSSPSVGLATTDSFLIATLPLAFDSGSLLGIPIVGLVIPFRQALPLLGMDRFAPVRTIFAEAVMPANTAMHYVCAVMLLLRVPRASSHRV